MVRKVTRNCEEIEIQEPTDLSTVSQEEVHSLPPGFSHQLSLAILPATADQLLWPTLPLSSAAAGRIVSARWPAVRRMLPISFPACEMESTRKGFEN